MINKKGFTLIEMLLVVVIIGIVTLITFPNLSEMLTAGKNKKYEEYVELLKENLKMYRINNNETLQWDSNGIVNVTYDNLKKINSDINIDEACIETSPILTITRISKDALAGDLYNYTYQVCISCTNDNTVKTYGDCE